MSNFLLTFFRRYRDKERSKSPDTVVTSAPTFKSDEVKKTINVKASVKPVTAAPSASRAPKKIDMGAALNYGKAGELGINSPTHRNTHNEDLFGDEPVIRTSTVRSSNDIIEDIFSSASSAAPIDDFDPRAEETADFGDFASAFGGSLKPAAPAAAPVSNEFADFSSAFSAPVAAAPVPVVDNFLFASSPVPQQSASSLLGSADLFGNSVITSAFTSPTAGGSSSGGKDLLSDFGDLTLNPIQGEF